MTARDLKTGQWLRDDNFDQFYFDEIDTEQKAYWLGFLYADGNITDRGILQLGLGSKDLSHIEEFRLALHSQRKIHSYVKKDKYNSRTIFSIQHFSSHMAIALQRNGIVPRKTKIITMPQLDFILQPHFFRGYFDGDGSVFQTKSDVKKPYQKLTLNIIGNIHFVNQMQDMLIEHLGVNKTKLNIPKHSPEMAYMIYSGTPQVKRIASWMYHDATIWLPRKRERFNIE